MLSAIHVVFDIVKLGSFIFSWLVKFLAKFGKYRRNCASDEEKYGHLRRDVWVHKVMLLPLVTYRVAVGFEKRYTQCRISRVS